MRSTGESDEAKAQRIADGWQQAADAVLSSPHQARQVLREILAAALGEDRGTLTTRKYVEKWLGKLKPTIAPNSYEFYRSTTSCFLQAMGKAADDDIANITEEHLTEWRNKEAARVTAKTVNHRIKAMRRVFKDAEKDGYVIKNPMPDLARVKPTPEQRIKIRRPFTFEELLRLDAAMDDQWKVVLWMGYFTGQRLGDIARFRWAGVDSKNSSLNLITGKTQTPVWQPVAPELMERLKQWRGQRKDDRSPFLFPSLAAQVDASAGRVGRLSNRFAHYLWKAGLRNVSPFGRDRAKERARKQAANPAKGHDRRERQELTFHCLRHTARSVLEVAGIPKAVIDAYIGQEGEMGKTYTTVGHDALRIAASALSSHATNVIPIRSIA